MKATNVLYDLEVLDNEFDEVMITWKDENGEPHSVAAWDTFGQGVKSYKTVLYGLIEALQTPSGENES